LRVSKTENLSKTDTNNRVFGDIRTRDWTVTSTWNTFSVIFQASVSV
jgi:hypothetical protein